MLRSRVSFAGCGNSYDGLSASEEIVFYLFLSAADVGSVKEINNAAAMTNLGCRISDDCPRFKETLAD
jgi:hypothetical protein